MALRHKLQKYLHGATLAQVAKKEFYFSQRLLQLGLATFFQIEP
jgi:hypothetical protein